MKSKNKKGPKAESSLSASTDETGNSYLVTPGAIARPRAIKIGGVFVGIGGSIQRTPQPPLSAYVIREATPEEYLQLARRGNPLVKLIG